MCCGNAAGSYLRLIDSCITQLKGQGTSRTCNESTEEEEEEEEALFLLPGMRNVRLPDTFGFTDYSQVDMLDMRNKSVAFGAEKSPDLPNL